MIVSPVLLITVTSSITFFLDAIIRDKRCFLNVLQENIGKFQYLFHNTSTNKQRKSIEKGEKIGIIKTSQIPPHESWNLCTTTAPLRFIITRSEYRSSCCLFVLKGMFFLCPFLRVHFLKCSLTFTKLRGVIA